MSGASVTEALRRFLLKMVYTGDLAVTEMLRLMLIACVFSAYVFFIYRLITRKTVCSRSFGIALSLVCVIVSGIIMTIQSSIVVSLGMVGSLSIVRFRTAVKDPMDLAFLFWSISVGIIVGAGLPGVALTVSAVVTAGMLILERIPMLKPPVLLIVSAKDRSARDAILKAVAAHTKTWNLKSQTSEADRLDMIIEVRSANANALVDGVCAVEGITRCTLMDHSGEAVF